MERSNKHRSRRDRKTIKAPKVPIKTYRWEDIRRSRRRGGYPWTHLYKGPFTEKVDPEEFTMDALRRAKSSSPMGRRSDRIDISEVSSWADYSGKTTPTLLHELISEPQEEHSMKNSRPGSAVIEEYMEDNDNDLEDDVQVKEFQTESAESSDNISQYLDKEEIGPATSKTTTKKTKRLLEGSKDHVNVAATEKRTKSEESEQRKRKVSAESTHSKYSLSKFEVIKKLQDAKNKIKVPKISFSIKKTAKKRISPLREDRPKKDIKLKPLESSRLRKPDKPVYIHIPLKPPPGESDQFSHLEFESKQKENEKISESMENKSGALESQVVNPAAVVAKKMEIDINYKNESEDDNYNIELKEKTKDKSPFSTLERGPRVTKKPPLKINPAFKQLLKDVRQLENKESDTDLVSDAKEKDKNKDSRANQESVVDELKHEDSATAIKEEISLDLELQQTSEDESPKEDVFDKLFDASVSKKEEEGCSGIQGKSSKSRNIRSKSAEPQSKRRSSMDSSYSRKSLSKLAIMNKKIKDASEKIKSAFSKDNFKKSGPKNEDERKKKSDEEESKKAKLPSLVKASRVDKQKPKNVEPVYIHIPLKPPEGETDQFSYLAKGSGNVDSPESMKEERKDSLDSASPASPHNDDIHFIFLTPPSDDEILDEKEPDIPETPSSSSDDMVFFSSLKKLAQNVVDQVSPETQINALETVTEEGASDKDSTSEIAAVGIPETNKETINFDQTPVGAAEISKELEEQMIVDVEDGLNEPSKTEEHLKSALKTTETSNPKRVSFKRKSKTPKGDDRKDKDYETIEAPEEKPGDLLPQSETVKREGGDEIIKDELSLKENDSATKDVDLSEKLDVKKEALFSDINQPLSVDEEKSYLDQKIVKDSSPEGDYEKWSNVTSDHEYEPVNPPDEMTIMSSSLLPNVTVVDTEDTDPKIVISATDILDKPIEEKRKPFFQFGRFHRDKGLSSRGDRGGSSDTQSRSSQGRDLPEMEEKTKASDGRNKFQLALRQHTEQLKSKTNELRNKIHNMKKPNVHLPKSPQFKKPDFKRFKIEKPNINLHFPKIPNSATIHLPHINLPGARKTTETRTTETRQFSTESNADESEQHMKRHKFDLSFGGTFPRFRKKKNTETEVAFATTPRAKKNKEIMNATVSSDSSSIRIALHSEDSTDAPEGADLEEGNKQNDDFIRIRYDDRETSVDVVRMPGSRFSREVPIEDDYERENQAINRVDYLNRWQHGNFKGKKDDRDNKDELIVGQLVEQRFGRGEQGFNRYEEDDDEDQKSETLEERLKRDEGRPRYIEDEEEEFDMRLMQNKHMVTDLDNLEDTNTGETRDEYSSEGSGSLHRKGRLGKLDVDSDEFFVVHEIREGFQTPANALVQMNEYDPIGSNRSLPMQMRERQELQPIKAERKSIKKPKRKKTPHVSQEEIPGDEESIEGMTTPSRPKRRSKKNRKKTERDEAIVPYQETIPMKTSMPRGQRMDFPRESLGILGDDERDDQEFEMYENERMRGKDQPDILLTDPYKQFQMMEQRFGEKEEPWSSSKPSDEPATKHKSLTQLENDSIFTDDEYENERNLEAANFEHQIQAAPPRRPSRRSRSHTSSLSRVSLPPSQRDTGSVFTDEGYLAENLQIPSYLIENQNYKQQFPASQEIASYLQKDRQPCIEEPCVQDLRDCMGYAIVDKSKSRDPPLPPPRTPPRRKKWDGDTEPERKFATVPRNMGLGESQAPPVRPLRNYSTLSHIKSSRKDSCPQENDKDNKENAIEIDEEVSRDLVSGEVVKKMRQRPLPAPPRPPRKARRSLQDITSKENIISEAPSDPKASYFQEETVSTQTEPLPPDFICEEIRQEPTDTIITPKINESKHLKQLVQKSDISGPDNIQQVERFNMYDPRIRRELITPSVYSFEETVTHGTLLVQPIKGAKVVPDDQLSRERLVPVTKESSDEDVETSEVPESFILLKSSYEGQKLVKEVLKADKLEVSNLDVDRLTVNQLLASKIVVSEIESNEIQGRGGAIRLGDMELPPQLLEQLVKQLETHVPVGELSRPPAGAEDISRDWTDGQKKTPTDNLLESLKSPASISTSSLETSLEGPRTTLEYKQQQEHCPMLVQQQETLTQDPLRQSSIEPFLDRSRLSGDELLQREYSESNLSPVPPVPPPRICMLNESTPDAPPRLSRRKSKQESPRLGTEEVEEPEPMSPNPLRSEMLELDVDDQPPPRPPQPLEGLYLPSQPPASFYALRAKQFVDENIPTVPRRKRHQSGRRSRPVSRSRSTSDDSSTVPHRPSRIPRRSSESSIPELSGRLIQACGSRINNTLKRLIYHLTENVLRNVDGNQDLHVFMIILLVLIAGLILLGYGEDRTVVHLHHWEYFNPPKDL